MFSLIITIVSIALVVALVAATMYHGGDTLTQGRDRADAAALVTGAQQVAAAASMHLALDRAAAADINELVSDNYLSSAPDGSLTLAADTVTAAASANICDILNADNSSVYDCVADAGVDTIFGTADDTAQTPGTAGTFVFRY